MSNLRRIVCGVAVATGLLLLPGCGATVARAKVISAETALGAAMRAGAEAKAPYEYTSAQLYLQKAREEENAARFGPAIEFGSLAEKHAEQARVKAMQSETQPTP